MRAASEVVSDVIKVWGDSFGGWATVSRFAVHGFSPRNVDTYFLHLLKEASFHCTVFLFLSQEILEYIYCFMRYLLIS